jgi:WD40 repeat protein/Flp pilus assembly protein TadD
MESDDRLDDILDAWQEAFDRGNDILPAELCRDCPDLIPEVERRVALLRQLAGLHRQTDAAATASVGDPDVGSTATGGAPGPTDVPPVDGPPGFEILSELGRGAMGVVYEARQLGLNRLVALKMVLAGPRASAAELLRFRNEGESVARLNHPNVVQVYEVGAHGGRPYLVMEHCAGGTLQEKLADSPLAPRDAAALVATLARAVHAAHAAGIVHRDLKPGNILLAADGTPKVGDFGLAKWADAGDGVTVTGAVIGTPSFMAPEQASSSHQSLDRRADVYALGAILYACLTGRPPFRGATALDTLDQVRSTEPVPVRALQPGVPRDLETICLKCLQKGSDRRYISAAALADDLERYQRGEPILARPVGSLERGWRWCRRNPAVAGLLAAVLLTSLTGTGVAMWYAEAAGRSAVDADRRRKEAEDATGVARREKVEADTARSDLQKQKKKADDAREVAVKEKKDADIARLAAVGAQRKAEWSAYISQISLSHREWEVGNAPSAFQILEATNSELRGWEYSYLQRLYTRDQKWQVKHAPTISALAVSPDGVLVATVGNSELVVSDAATGKVHFRSLASHRNNSAVAFSPDGRYVLTGDGWDDGKAPGVIRRWEVASGKALGELLRLPRGITTLQFRSADEVVAGCCDNNVYWIEVGPNRVARSVQVDVAGANRAAVSKDGRFIVTSGFRSPPQLRDGSTGELIRVLDEPAVEEQRWPLSIAFSPNGELIAGTGPGWLFAWDANTGKNLWAVPDELLYGGQIAWTPDGKSIVTASEGRIVTVRDPRTGRQRKRFLGHLAPVYSLGVTDGVIYTAGNDGTVIAWDSALPEDPLTLRSPGVGWFGGLRFVPGEAALVSVEGGNPIVGRLWDLRTGRATRTFAGHTAHITDLTLARSGDIAFTASEDGTARMWNVRTGACSTVFRGHTGRVYGVTAPPDAAWVATSGQDGEIRLWDPATGSVLRTLHRARVPAHGITSDPDGRLLAASFSDGSLRVWDAATWKELHQFQDDRAESGRAVTRLAVAFTPDRRVLVSGGTNLRLTAWDLASGKPLWSLDSGPAPVLAIAMLPGGKQFVAATGTWATPGEVKVWNTLTGENTLTLRGFGRECWAVAADPVTGAVAACTHEGIIRVWGSSVPGSATVRADRYRALWREAEKRGDWSAAAFHLSQLARMTPEDHALHLRAAHLWKLAGRPERAALHATWSYFQDPSLPASPAYLAFPEGPGRWRIDGQELVQEARAQNCWLVFGDPDWTDYDLELQVKRVEGAEGGAIGFRATGAEDFYMINLGWWKNTVSSIEKSIGGRYSPQSLTSRTPLQIEAGRWYQVKIEVRGDRLRVLLDGKELHTAQDGQFKRGKVGVRSWNTVNRFRNIKVTAPDGTVLFEGLPYLTSNAEVGAVALTAGQQLALAESLSNAGDLSGALAAAREAVRLDPTNFRAHFRLGYILNQKRDWAGAVTAYKEAVRLDTRSSAARNNLGVALRQLGRLDEAEASYREAIRLNPRDAKAHRNLGSTLHQKGDAADAIAAYRESIRIDPNSAVVHAELGDALRAVGDFDGAVAAYRAAVRLGPNSVPAHFHLGLALYNQGQVAEAVEEYRTVVRLDPKHAVAHNNLAWLRATYPDAKFRDGTEAVEYAAKAVALSSRYWSNLDTLAAAFAEAGDFEKAVATQREAIDRFRSQPKPDPALLAELDAHLKLFQDRKPHREPAPVPSAPPPRPIR